MKKTLTLILNLLVLAAIGQTKNVTLSGAGATFPQPFYTQLISDYSKKTGVQVSYGGIGSGGGIKSLKDKVVDFGASDAFLTDKELADFSAPIVHMPTCLGAVVLAYNLPGINSIRMSNETLVKIFMGEITKWNDSQIKAENREIKLPDMKISVIYRSDGSGTTFIFSDYMSKISEKWSKQVGTGKALNWPVGMGAKGNPGVSGMISQTVGSIGYIGSEYAFAQKISSVKLKNKAGNYIEPSVESVTAAAQGQFPADTRVMVTNSSNPKAYPISGFTWIIVYKEQAYNGRTLAQAQETVKFLQFILSPEAQAVAPKITYAPLPAKAVNLAQNVLKSITYNGKSILK